MGVVHVLAVLCAHFTSMANITQTSFCMKKRKKRNPLLIKIYRLRYEFMEGVLFLKLALTVKGFLSLLCLEARYCVKPTCVT